MRSLARCRDAVLIHGLCAGWIAVLLLAGADVMSFRVLVPPQGIISALALDGYPKQADYIWYGLMVVGGLAGAVVNAALADALGGRGRPRSWAPAAGAACLAGAAVHGSRLVDPATWPAWALLVAGCGLPWLDSAWALPAPESGEHDTAGVPTAPHPGWAAGALVVAGVWIYDACLAYRPIDGLHEGGQLVYVQSWLAGDLPGLDTRAQYGPLYAHSLAWWTTAFGPTLSAARGYFLAAQMLGTAIHLWLIRATVRRGWPLATGVWLMLTLSTAPNIQFGWGNALRTAVPLLAMWCVWRGHDGWSGMLASVGGLYSQEYGLAGAAGCAVLLGMAGTGAGRRGRAARAGAWMAGAILMFAAGLGLLFGSRAAAAASRLGGGGYAFARLLGHAVSPLPAFPWWESWAQVAAHGRGLLELAAIWGAGFLAAGVLARLPRWRRQAPESAAWLAGMAVFTLLAQIPVLARPLWQIAAATPAAILLGTAAADLLLGEGRGARRAGGAGLAVAAAYAFAIFLPMAGPLTSKAACFGMAPLALADPALARLGSVRVGSGAARELRDLVAAIRSRTPAGARVYLAAPRFAHACFLADRAALPPFALTYLAATRGERLAMVAALEQQRPPLAILTDAGIDLPYRVEHPEEAAWLAAHYRLELRIGEVQLWVPRGPLRPRP